MIRLSSFRWNIRLALALSCLSMSAGALGPSVLAAQGTVTGRVTILERGDGRTADLANTVVWIETKGAAPWGDSADAPIVMESRTFVPRVRVMRVGSTVSFPNQDPFRHNVFSKSGPSEFDLGLYARGQSRGARFARPGVYPIFCNIHAKMTAYVVAVPGAATQAGADGSFTLANVPAGRHVLRVWHERGGEVSVEVDVGAAAVPPLDVRLDARNYRLVQHRNKFGQEYTTTGRDRY